MASRQMNLVASHQKLSSSSSSLFGMHHQCEAISHYKQITTRAVICLNHNNMYINCL